MSASLADHTLHGVLYGDAEAAALFTADADLAAMVRFETALAQAQADMGLIPGEAAAEIAARLPTIPLEPEALSAGVASDGIVAPALVRHLRAAIGAPHGQYVHWGATSQDVIDTSFVLRAGLWLDLMDARLAHLTTILATAARRWAETPMAARTRTQIATPTTFGLRIAGWLGPVRRRRDQIADLRARACRVQLGGASGTLAAMGPQGPAIADRLADRLQIGRADKPWHVERDTLVDLGTWAAALTAALGRMAGDLILMGRSEMREALSEAGGGSSTMPHKSNPVLAEAVVALARKSAGDVGALHLAALSQEERDGASWPLEWATLPAMMIGAAAAARHATTLAQGLRPDPARMAALLEASGADAEKIAFALAAHMPLPDAQAIVKAAAHRMAETPGGALQEAVAALTDAPIDWAAVSDRAADVAAAAAWVARSAPAAD